MGLKDVLDVEASRIRLLRREIPPHRHPGPDQHRRHPERSILPLLLPLPLPLPGRREKDEWPPDPVERRRTDLQRG